ncbi:MAG TPA: BamA/TamA family outer membrane protein [Acetobacteraceae bacterium]|jgi:translocation and assembly module TamA
MAAAPLPPSPGLTRHATRDPHQGEATSGDAASPPCHGRPTGRAKGEFRFDTRIVLKRMRLALPPVLLFLLATAIPARAANPQPYATKLAPTHIAPLDTALHDASSLIALQKKAPVGGFALVQRTNQDVGRFQAVLNSFGYYKAQVTATIDGHPASDPTLPDLIDHAPANPPVPVDVSFEPGPLFHLGRVSIHGTLPPGVQSATGLSTGEPALAASVVGAQERMLDAIRNDGYPLAKVELPPVTLHVHDNTMDVTMNVTTGPTATFGPIAITGLKYARESYVRKRLLLHQGEKFSADAIDKAQQDLASLGLFAVVRIVTATQLDANGQLPLTVQLTESKLHTVDAGIGYSTDLGVNFNVGWHDRDLFGNGEQLNLTAQMNLGGSAETQPGYQFLAQFIKPDFLRRDQSLELDLGAIKQALEAYDQRAVTQKAALDRKLSPHWTVSYGISGEQEEIAQEDVDRHYELVGLPLTAKYDTTTSLFDPTSGVRALFSVTPTGALGSQDSGFVIMQASGSTYFDFGTKGHTVLALRGLLGEVPGTNVFSLPPDQRFYAGGSGTVRGFKYQSVGPQFADGNPEGGTAIAAGTVELRQRIIGNYGAVAFVDAGQVTSQGAPFTSAWRVGAGVGFRYYTSIGPIRLDVAVPVNREPHGDAFELYIGIGQAF